MIRMLHVLSATTRTRSAYLRIAGFVVLKSRTAPAKGRGSMAEQRPEVASLRFGADWGGVNLTRICGWLTNWRAWYFRRLSGT